MAFNLAVTNYAGNSNVGRLCAVTMPGSASALPRKIGLQANYMKRRGPIVWQRRSS